MAQGGSGYRSNSTQIEISGTWISVVYLLILYSLRLIILFELALRPKLVSSLSRLMLVLTEVQLVALKGGRREGACRRMRRISTEGAYHILRKDLGNGAQKKKKRNSRASVCVTVSLLWCRLRGIRLICFVDKLTRN